MNTLLTSETGLSVATGCALFLLGLSLGLLVAGVCLAFAAASSTCQESSLQEHSISISDDEIELVIELVREAVAGSGWTLCGDCYARNLLQQVPLPNPAGRGLQHSGKNRPEQCLRVERIYPQGKGKVTIPPDAGKNRLEQHLCEGQVYPVGRRTPPCCIVNERNAS